MQLESLGGVVGDNFENDGVDIGGTVKVVLIFDHDDGLAHVPAVQLVGAGAHGILKIIGFPHILPLEQVLGQDGHGHVVQERIVGLGQHEGDLGVGKHIDFLDLLVVGVVLGTVVGILDGFDGEFHILSSEAFPIVPLHIAAKPEGVGHGCFIIRPSLGQTGNQLALAVPLHQAVKQKVLDFAVLVHNGVDGIIVAGAVDQRGVVCSKGSCCQAENHHHGQHQAKKLFHVVSSSYFCFRLILTNSFSRYKPGGGMFFHHFFKKFEGLLILLIVSNPVNCCL